MASWTSLAARGMSKDRIARALDLPPWRAGDVAGAAEDSNEKAITSFAQRLVRLDRLKDAQSVDLAVFGDPP